MNAAGAARLFLMARGRRPAVPSDCAALEILLTEFAKSGFIAGVQRAKDEYTSRHSGGCRMLSQGDGCECFLCACDNLLLLFTADKEGSDGSHPARDV